MLPVVDDIITKIDDASFDYNSIINNSISVIQTESVYDINFIVTVRNRLFFSESMFDSFAKARDNTDLEVCYTLVEHSISPEHFWTCKRNKVNYIWIPSDDNEQFNKCLAYNMGALFTNNCKWLLFHDIDILIPSDFFDSLFHNINAGDECMALQCYTKRRILSCRPGVSQKLIEGKLSVTDLNKSSEGIMPLQAGSTGGSILVDRNLFIDAGGFDPELFQAYSHEDAFFWEKLSILTKIKYADNPPIELFHLWHIPQIQFNPYFDDMEDIYNSFKELSTDDKLKIIKYKSKKLKEIDAYNT